MARVETCPWRAFTNPVVRDVMSLYQMASPHEGRVNLATVRLTNPPAHLWEGLQVYAASMARNLNEVAAAEAEKSKRKR